MRTIISVLLISYAVTVSGCGIFVGNVKPRDEKSEEYGISDLSKENFDWKKLDSSTGLVDSHDPTTSSEVADVAYQSAKTGSIISINSSCRTGAEYEKQELKSFSDLLFLGVSDISRKEERGLTLQSVPALQTTVKGIMNGEEMALRAVVLKKHDCIYDLMYIARPDHFSDQELDFSHFVASLRLK